MLRLSVRISLCLAALTAILVIAASLYFLGFRDPSTWAAVAGALAVITSVISAWPAQRVLELQQDAQKPYLYPSFDLDSRYGLVQLVVTNYGGSAAHDVRITWNTPLVNADGEPIRFTKQLGVPDIPVLLPGVSVRTRVDGDTRFFKLDQVLNYSGTVSFKDASGRLHKEPFVLSAEQYRQSYTYFREEPRTHFELQKIPGELHKIQADLHRLSRTLEQMHRADQANE